MVNVKENLTGRRFGRLLVLKQTEDWISPSDNTVKRARWLCQCDCGNQTVVEGSVLKNGKTLSCGCLMVEKTIQRNISNKKSNKYDLSGEYGIGYTYNKSKDGINYFYFDLEDYDKIKDYCWNIDDNNYIKTYDDNRKMKISMHRLIMGLINDDNKTKIYVDHKKHITYDNRKSELRIVTNTENQMNKIKQSNNNSGVPGVSWHKRDKVWVSYITLNKNKIYLGKYKNFEDAVNVRKDAEEKYFGKYSYDNSIKE